MPKKKKSILILGAGVGGIRAAQTLQEQADLNKFEIVLVDQSAKHVLRADLYEVATAFQRELNEECLCKLSNTVATSISDLIDEERLCFIQKKVVDILPEKRQVKLKGRRALLHYDYLIVALGSVAQFYGTPGLDKHAFPLKTVEDALNINCHLNHFFAERLKNKNHSPVDIVIGGGGATGVEMAAELSKALRVFCKRYRFPRKKVRVVLIQGGDTLGGFGLKGTVFVKRRLEDMGVKVLMKHRIQKVTSKSVTVKGPDTSAHTHAYSILIWTAGIQVPDLLRNTLGSEEKGGAIWVNEKLQSLSHKRVFAVGDNAYLTDPHDAKHCYPRLAWVAAEQGDLAAKNILRAGSRQPLKAYNRRLNFFVVPVGGKYALLKTRHFLFKGVLMWFFRRLAILHYHMTLLPPWQAFKKWRHGNEIFEGND